MSVYDSVGGGAGSASTGYFASGAQWVSAGSANYVVLLHTLILGRRACTECALWVGDECARTSSAYWRVSVGIVGVAACAVIDASIVDCVVDLA
mgnify:CR=1 FL=1